MISPDLVQKVLVLSGELSYLEQASETNQLITTFLGIFRHCNSSHCTVSLFKELQVANRLVVMLQGLLPAYQGISVQCSDSFRSVEVVPGSAIDFINDSFNSTDSFLEGRKMKLSWAQGQYIWEAEEKL